jgi:hypothetical protein
VPACLPFRGFGRNRSGSSASPPRPTLSWNRLLVQSSPRPVSQLLVLQSHSAVGPCLGLMVFPSRVQRIRLTNPPATLFEFRLPPESFSVAPSQPRRRDVRSRLLSWAPLPFSTCRTRGSTCRGFASPATFRPQGLITLSTVSSPRVRAGLVSCRQRSWDSALRSISFPKGTRDVTASD